MRVINIFEYFSTPDNGLNKYDVKSVNAGNKILATVDISRLTNMADHVNRRNARNIMPEAILKTIFIIALPKMKFITLVKTDKTSLTGNRIIFNISATPFISGLGL